MVLVVAVAACGNAPPSVAEALAEACAEARSSIAAAPAATDASSEMAFRMVSEEAAHTAARVADDLAGQGDDQTIADLAWQLHHFPRASEDNALRAAHEASAAILRIDGFARTLEVPACRAGIWRPDDWRAMANRHADRPSHGMFRETINDLCAETFPDPDLLRAGVPLLTALVAGPMTDEATEDPVEHVKARLVARLHTVSGRPSDARRFLTAFSNDLPEIAPSEDMEEEHVALLAAFLRLDSAIPRGMSRHPPPATRERVDGALDELQAAWNALDITC